VFRCIVALVALIGTVLPVPALAQPDQRCFPETGFCISGRIRTYWEQNGGLPVFGLPITPQQEQVIEGKALQVQWFERNRLELHPENAAPYDVLLGRLGADRLAQQGRDPFAFPTDDAAQDGCRYFAETKHNVCADILAAWRANGLDLGEPGISEGESLALFGLPLSGVIDETLSDGRSYRVQYFERARFELHPENQPPYNVLLGLLGNEVRGSGQPAQPAPQPAPTPSPTPQPAPQPGAGGDCPTPPSSSAPNTPIAIIAVDKRAETVTIQNVSGTTVDVSNWTICSVRGNQLHAVLSGPLAPGESRVVTRQANADIWSNSESDPAVLYDPSNQLISYFAS
jgi:hypothetical protein